MAMARGEATKPCGEVPTGGREGRVDPRTAWTGVGNDYYVSEPRRRHALPATPAVPAPQM